MKINKKVIMALYLVICVITISVFTGCASSAASIDSGSIVISKSVDETGNPIDIIEAIRDDSSVPTIDKNGGDIYVSIKVKNKKLKQIRVLFNEGNNQENKISNTTFDVTESGYINYYISNVKNLKSSKYSFAFVNGEGVTEARCSFNIK